MIKLPIVLRGREDWKAVVGDAIRWRDQLEDIAKAERAATKEYIRPILLFQAQRQIKDKETITPPVLKQALIDDFRIPEDRIKIATGSHWELRDPQSVRGGLRGPLHHHRAGLARGLGLLLCLCALLDCRAAVASGSGAIAGPRPAASQCQAQVAAGTKRSLCVRRHIEFQGHRECVGRRPGRERLRAVRGTRRHSRSRVRWISRGRCCLQTRRIAAGRGESRRDHSGRSKPRYWRPCLYRRRYAQDFRARRHVGAGPDDARARPRPRRQAGDREDRPQALSEKPRCALSRSHRLQKPSRYSVCPFSPSKSATCSSHLKRTTS